MQVPAVSIDQVPQPLPEALHVLDVREPEEWAAGHIEGALHIPLQQVPQRLEELPTDGQLLVVCHVGAAANVLGVPLVVQVSEIRAFLLANPRDYLGACEASSPDGDAGNGPGHEGADAGGNAGGDAGASAQAPGVTSASAGAVAPLPFRSRIFASIRRASGRPSHW